MMMTSFRQAADNLFASQRESSKGHHKNKTLSVHSEGISSRNHQTALHRASSVGQVELVQRLIANGSKVNACDLVGRTPLYEAATEGHVEVVKELLKNGAHTDAQDEMQGNSALHQAAWQGYSNMLEALCQGKSNVYLKNKIGFSALHLACQNGHNQSCRVLLWAGCNPDIKNNYGDTPLHTAARYGHAGVMRILISAFCAVNDTNKNGDTALHIAAAMSWRKLTKILLESRCDQQMKNRQEETALDIARRKEFVEIETILLNPPKLAPVATQKALPKVDKKPENKDSGTSLGSAEKPKKSKSGNRVHFSDRALKKPFKCPGANSPYGCPMGPNTTTFPTPKLDTLPTDPLSKGEQYYVDLAGNIRKGAIGVGLACFCKPKFEQMEKTMNTNKKELMDRIDHKCQNLKSKIDHLERRTKHRFTTLDQTVKEKLAEEKQECMGRVDRRADRERREFETQQMAQADVFRSDMKNYVDAKVRGATADFALRTRKEKLSEASMYMLKARSQVLLTDTESNAVFNSWPLVPSSSEKILSRYRKDSHTIEEFI